MLNEETLAALDRIYEMEQLLVMLDKFNKKLDKAIEEDDEQV
jgi:hypothetical protein|tara:strand:+ start:297 stop:422 length:126 start_codon:yes stop_codon:yes gene_type:complete